MGEKPSIKLEYQENISGDKALAPQGFGCVSPTPALLFDPERDHAAACEFFRENGYVVLANCLDGAELAHLNEFYDRTQGLMPDRWGLGERRRPHHRGQGLIYSQPLLDHPELDRYTQHPRSFPVAAELLGGVDKIRFSEFNFREAPADAGHGAMNFHHDATVQDRFVRRPYMPCDWLCAIHYLTDVNEDTPAFCVVPKSHVFESLKEAHESLGDDYVEVPIRGPAGTCVLYDTAIYHTRLDGDGHLRRRTWHQYYARGGWLKSATPTSDRYVRPPSPVLTNWNLFPERLAMSEDPAKRLFFSHWNTAQCEWVASGFSDEVRNSMPRGEQ